MKKIAILIFLMLLSLFLATPTFASQDIEETLDELNLTGEIIYQDDEITVRSFGDNPEIAEAIFNHPDSVVADNSLIENKNDFTPFSSVTGPGGRSSIVASDTGRSVYWSVKPATSWPYSFSGLVKLRYYSGFSRDVPVGGISALGKTLSGTVTMNKNNGGVTSLSGTAVAINGSAYTVLPGVSTTFRAN